MTTKTCNQCGTEKPITEFYRNCRMKDGRVNQCRACKKMYVPPGGVKKLYPEYMREYRRSPEWKASKKRYRSRHPKKTAARVMITNAVQAGRLIRLPCEVCGDLAQAHHDDYNKPLEIRWLCRTHHAEWHRHNKAIEPYDDERKQA